MPQVTRFGDDTVGVCDIGEPCCAHGRNGANVQVSPDVWVNGLGVHRLTDTGDCRCPHGGIYKSTEGSPDVFVNGLPVTRIGDTTTCTSCGMTGNHTGGSPDVWVN